MDFVDLVGLVADLFLVLYLALAVAGLFDADDAAPAAPPPPPPFNSPEEGRHAQMKSAERRRGGFPISDTVREVLVLQLYCSKF